MILTYVVELLVLYNYMHCYNVNLLWLLCAVKTHASTPPKNGISGVRTPRVRERGAISKRSTLLTAAARGVLEYMGAP